MINKGLHHFHLRKRIFQNLERFPHPDKFKRFYDKLIYFVVFLGPILNLPQLIKIIIIKDASGLSILSWLGFSSLSLIWMGYGILHEDKPIIYANIGLFSIQILIIIGIFLYR